MRAANTEFFGEPLQIGVHAEPRYDSCMPGGTKRATKLRVHYERMQRIGK